jgi:small subunit ribosomal protein S11
MADEPEIQEEAKKEEAPAAEAAPESAEPAAKEEEAPAKTESPEKKESPEKAESPEKTESPAETETPRKEKKERTAEDIFLELEGGEETEKPKILKAKGSKNVHVGIVHVSATFNNTIVTVSDMSGNVIGWSSAGKMGFRGSRKSTAYAAQLVSQDACRQAMGHGLREAEVRVKGPGAGRESAVRAVQALGIDISKIKDVTPVPHNGCRPKKARRV